MKILEMLSGFAQISRGRLLPALMLGAVVMTANCSAINDEDNSDDETLALLAAAYVNQCNVGGQGFSAAGLACSLNSAAGTGTLTAASTATSFVSMQLTFQLLGSDSSLAMVAGLNPSARVATSNAGGELLVTPTVTKKPQDGGAGAAGAGTSPQTWCFEIHVDESPMHAILDQTTCSAKAASAVTYENDADGPSIQGGLWGFVLKNAAITNIVFNGQKIFSE